MKPYKYTKLEDGKTKYHYTFSQLREFLTHGFKEGNNGWTIVGSSENFTDYRGFGTIENPCKSLISISVEHDPFYDGKKSSPEDVVNPPKREELFTNHRAVIWDARTGVTEN
jgi:hypothetical protein